MSITNTASPTRRWVCAFAAFLGLLGLPGLAHASFVPPAGVTAYRLAFVTSDTIDATSSDISTYNALVATDAALNALLPATTWTALASTAGVDAVNNISCGGTCDSSVPIFLVDGTEVATSTAALFTGAILTPINEDETGTASSAYVWTGTNAGSGAAISGFELGASQVEYGSIAFASSNVFNMISFGTDPNTTQLSLYAISAQIAVPEPMSLSLLGFGGLAIGLVRRPRRRRQMPA